MKFLIKYQPEQVLVDLDLDIPSVLKSNSALMNYDDYFEYFSEHHFHICNFKSLKFSDGIVEGANCDLNLFIWIAMAHQAYMERKMLLSTKYIEDLENTISNIFDRELEAVEWFMAIHRAIDLYLKSNVQLAAEFLPANIVPLNEITNYLNQLKEGEYLNPIEKYEVSTVVYS